MRQKLTLKYLIHHWNSVKSRTREYIYCSIIKRCFMLMIRTLCFHRIIDDVVSSVRKISIYFNNVNKELCAVILRNTQYSIIETNKLLICVFQIIAWNTSVGSKWKLQLRMLKCRRPIKFAWYVETNRWDTILMP